MKKKMMVLVTVGTLAVAGLVYGFNSYNSTCPLEGTPECPKINCPLAGTPDCPYDNAELAVCCQKM